VRRANRLFVAIGNWAGRALLGGGKRGNKKRSAEQGSQGGERQRSNHDGDRITRQGAAMGGVAAEKIAG
jgi:hypothetical protein